MQARNLQTKLKTRRHLTHGRRGGVVYRKPRRAKGPRREAFTASPRRLFLIFLFLVAQLIFAGSELFNIRDISISGVSPITNEALLEQARLGPDANYWSVSPDTIERRLLSFHELRTVDVERVFPGMVSIRVAQRHPRYQVAMTAAKPEWFQADADGVILGKATADSKFPRIMVDQPVVQGARLPRESAFAVRESVRWLHTLLPGKPISYHVDANYEVTIKTLYRGVTLSIKVGQMERMEYKAGVLKALAGQFKSQKGQFELVDLRYATPVVRLKAEKKPE